MQGRIWKIGWRVVCDKAIRLLRSVSVLSIALCIAPLAVLAQELGDDDSFGGGATPGPAAVEAIVLAFGGGVEADALVTQVNVGNDVSGNNISQFVDINGSFSGNTGVLQANQDAGVFANQGNVVAIAVGGHADGAFADISVGLGVAYVDNSVKIVDGDFRNRIHNSFNGVSGITQVNQNTGAMNNQLNVVAMGIGVEGGGGLVALDDLVLSGYAGDNEAVVEEIEAENTITDSFNDYSGILQVNQVSGGVGVTAVQAVIVNINPVAAP